jgi:hypothetical protein
MDKEAIPRRAPAVLALAVALALAVLAVAAVVASPKAASAAPPEPVDDRFVAEGYCDFPVLVESTGKQIFRELPGGDFFLFVRSTTTFTNLDDPENRVVDRGGGAGRIKPLENGDVLVVARGHNYLFDPGEGIFLTVGKVRFTVASGPGVGGDITILESRGRLIDLCARLS